MILFYQIILISLYYKHDIYIYISYTDSPKIEYIIIRGANEIRQLTSYSDLTRSKLDIYIFHTPILLKLNI